MTDDARLEAALVAAVTEAAAAPGPVAAREDLVRIVAPPLDRRLGWGRVVIPGDRMPVAGHLDPDAPEAVAFDLGVRGRMAGRLHAAIHAALWDDADPDAPVAALLTVATVLGLRAWDGFVLGAAPGAEWRGAWGEPLADGWRATATVIRRREIPEGLRGVRVAARIGTQLVANGPLPAAGEGWQLRVVRVSADDSSAEVAL